MTNDQYSGFVEQIQGMGYDINKLVKIPQEWDSTMKKDAP
jgi:hypothetical protein